jgi:redox-sensitive bicupin YhaK (pirin superfamily)
MITYQPRNDRGHAEHGWLDSHHSFSFGEFYDAAKMGYGALRVINEDRVVGGAGFPPHSHRDMEIISYVIDGGLRHRDSTGGTSVILPGELQLMTAGSGITHSEMNASPVDGVHFLQIWVVPSERGAAPGYQQKALDADALRRGFTTVVAPKRENAPFTILQDARLLIAWPTAAQTLTQTLDPQRHYYVHLAAGEISTGGRTLKGGDALEISGESLLEIIASEDAQVLLFDLPV